MKPLRILGSAVAVIGGLLLVGATAEAKSDPPASEANTFKELQKSLKKRDALIHDLLRRVESLERQAPGRRPVSGKTANPGGNEAAPLPVASDGNKPPQPAQQPPPRQGVAAPSAPSTGRQVSQAPAPQAQAQAPEAAPGQFAVSPEAAERALERALVQTGALLLPPGTVEVVPSLTYQFQQISRPSQIALSTSGTVLVTEDVLRSTSLQAGGLARVGLPWDAQVEVGAPYAYKNLTTASRALGAGLSEQSTDAVGFGDPVLTLTKQLMKESEWWPSLFASGTWNADLGQGEKGIPLGAGFHEFAAGLVATKRQDPLVFTAGFSYLTALEHNLATPGDQFTPSVGMLLAVSPETSLRAAQQLTFANKLKFNGRLIPGSQQISGVFTFGVLSILAPGLVVDLSAAVGETPDAPNLTIRLGLPIRLNW
jgi:hypothetical protein